MTITSASPAQSATAAPAGEGEEAKKGGALKKILVLVLAVAVVGYLAYSMVISPMLYPVVYKVGEPVPLGTTLDLDGTTGPITLNLADNGHLAQLDVVLQFTAVASTTRMTADTPQFQNAVVQVINSTTYEQITQQTPITVGAVTYPNGEALAKAEILAACQKIAGVVDGHAEQVAAVYFTNFVAQ